MPKIHIRYLNLKSILQDEKRKDGRVTSQDRTQVKADFTPSYKHEHLTMDRTPRGPRPTGLRPRPPGTTNTRTAPAGRWGKWLPADQCSATQEFPQSLQAPRWEERRGDTGSPGTVGHSAGAPTWGPSQGDYRGVCGAPPPEPMTKREKKFSGLVPSYCYRWSPSRRRGLDLCLNQSFV